MKFPAWPTAMVLTALLLSAVCMPAGAQALPAALHACMSIKSDGERLACFDRETAKLSVTEPTDVAAVQPGDRTSVRSAQGGARVSSSQDRTSAQPVQDRAGVQAASGKPSAGVDTTASAAAALAPEQTFGLSSDQIRKLEAHRQGVTLPAQLKNLTARIASVSHASTGRWVITLDNGQVWRQTETRSDFEASPGNAVRISTGAMGSFWLEINKHNWTRVERVL